MTAIETLSIFWPWVIFASSSLITKIDGSPCTSVKVTRRKWSLHCIHQQRCHSYHMCKTYRTSRFYPKSDLPCFCQQRPSSIFEIWLPFFVLDNNFQVLVLFRHFLWIIVTLETFRSPFFRVSLLNPSSSLQVGQLHAPISSKPWHVLQIVLLCSNPVTS